MAENNYEKWLPELQACPIFDDLTGDEIVHALNELAPVIGHYQKGEEAMKAGEKQKGFCVFLNTVPPKTPVRRKEKWRYPGLCTPGWIFAELPGFSDSDIIMRTFRVPAECYIMFIDADRFVGYCEKNDRVHRLLIRNQFGVFARKCIALKRAHRFFNLGDVTENVALFLCDEMKENKSAQFIPHRDNEELAEMMLIEKDAIDAAYDTLTAQKYIAIQNDGKVVILDNEGLKKAAGTRLDVVMGH
jgi:hypothetical protein